MTRGAAYAPGVTSRYEVVSDPFPSQKKDGWVQRARSVFREPKPKSVSVAGTTPAVLTFSSESNLNGWQNPYTGYGTSRDKLTYGYHTSSLRIDDIELSTLFYSDDVAAKLVEKRPEEAFRRGYELFGDGSEELEAKAEALGVNAKMQEAITWGRLWGGALLIIGAEQGDPSTPLQEEKVRDVRFLNVIDRRFAVVASYYDDPLSPNYGQPEIYLVNGMNGTSTRIHESRVIRFDGVPVDMMKRRELYGWTYSVLQRPYDVMRTFATAFQAAGILTADASQAVFKMKGLFEMIASGEKERLQTRMQLVDMSRSSARALLLDADGESFERVKTDFSGYPEMLDRMMMRLASSIDMPVTILMGRSPAGQNATGDSDFKHWYDSIISQQNKELTPKLLRLFRILSAGKAKNLEIEWCPLSEPTDKERAETEKAQAERDGIYIDKGVVIPEQVAIARFGSGNGRIAIDEKSLLKSIDLEGAFSKQLEKARGALGEKELAALSIAQGVSPVIVSSLIQAAGTPAADPPGTPPAPGAVPPPVKDPNAEPDAKPGEAPGGSPKP